MVNEEALRDALLSSIEESKNLYVMLSSVLAELDALRETVRGLDPTFGDVMEQKRKESLARSAEVVQASVDGYDQKFRQVKAGYVC
jgi:hypothetical protein